MDLRIFDLILQNIGDVLGYVTVAVLVVVMTKAKEHLNLRSMQRATRKTVTNSVVLSAFLGEVRAMTEADRLTVMQFHNGDHFASGGSVQKISITHCILRAGVSMPTNLGGDSLHHFPATFMTHLLDEAFDNGFARYSESQEPKDHWVQRYQTVNGIKTEIVCLIPGLHAQDSLGLLAFSWLEEHNLTPECIRDILAYAKRASAYL